jgi:uncharacterized protein YdaU (DUF1376 family)
VSYVFFQSNGETIAEYRVTEDMTVFLPNGLRQKKTRGPNIEFETTTEFQIDETRNQAELVNQQIGLEYKRQDLEKAKKGIY